LGSGVVEEPGLTYGQERKAWLKRKSPLLNLKMQASHGRESAILQQIMFYIRMRECTAQMESSSMEIIIYPHAMNTKAASCCNLGVILALPLMASSNFKPGTVQRFLGVPKKI
jgi:hypothetical protein